MANTWCILKSSFTVNFDWSTGMKGWKVDRYKNIKLNLIFGFKAGHLKTPKDIFIGEESQQKCLNWSYIESVRYLIIYLYFWLICTYVSHLISLIRFSIIISHCLCFHYNVVNIFQTPAIVDYRNTIDDANIFFRWFIGVHCKTAEIKNIVQTNSNF